MKPKSSSKKERPKMKPSRGEMSKAANDPPPDSTNGVHLPATSDVMTLAEAAAFLRAPEAVVEQMANEGKLPGRKVGVEWRFIQSALREWLSQSEAVPQLSSRGRMLAVGGAWKDDETFPQLIENIKANRKRLHEELS